MTQPSFVTFRVNWWVRWRDREPVRHALVAAHREHWVPAVEAALRRNADSGRSPMTFTQVSQLLGIGVVNFFRWRAGKTARESPSLTGHDFQTLAEILDIPTAGLFPQPCDQLTRAVMRLCRRRASERDARALAAYCLALPIAYWLDPFPDLQRLDDEAASAARCAAGMEGAQDFEQAVFGVARQLEAPLLIAEQDR